jgi:predicted metal-dependent hydrolase
MQKEITLRDKKIAYTFRKSYRSRRLRLAVYCDGSIVLTVPAFLREGAAERFIYEKAGWLLSKLYFFSQFKPNPISRYTKADYLRYKERASIFIAGKVRQLNTVYGYHYRKINVKNQKTRWGSCSRGGNLNFNYKILFLPEKMQDYIIAHEICHLKEFNHSKNFWALVARTVPDHAAVRKELKRSGLNFY